MEETTRELKRCKACGEIIISEYGCTCQLDEEMAQIIHDDIMYHD